MGTNYFLHCSPCKTCGKPDEVLHIGKLSAGWEFIFRGYDFLPIETIDDWKLECNKPQNQIRDQDYQFFTPEEFWKRIEASKGEQSHYNYIRNHPVHMHTIESLHLDPLGWTFDMNEFS